MTTSRLLLAGLLAILISSFFYFDLSQYLSIEALKAQHTELLAFCNAHPLQAKISYLLIYILATSLSLPGATLLTLAGGTLFGLWQGTMLVSFASSIGATIAFLSARFLLRDWVQQKFSTHLQDINNGIVNEGAWYLFSMRLVPLFPFFMINLVMGLTPIHIFTFYWVSQLGMLAGTIVYVNAGTQLAQLDSMAGILSPTMISAFVLLGVFPLITKKLLHSLSTI